MVSKQKKNLGDAEELGPGTSRYVTVAGPPMRACVFCTACARDRNLRESAAAILLERQYIHNGFRPAAR